jgi:hypothetical protein
LIHSVENPVQGVRVIEVPEIRAGPRADILGAPPGAF